uniref:Inner membrane protein YgaP-like transmembrane domain-containing protein n=1 Tax=mine drainage metagenome TaxID=410659 RepID=E6QV64_9ZZZZ
MVCNVGGADRAIRIIIGIVLIALAATHTVGVWGYIGVVPLLTGAMGWCPAYLPFGIKTCKTGKPTKTE